MAQYFIFIAMCALGALNIYMFVETGSAFSAAAAFFIALLCVRQAMFIAEAEGRKR